MNKLNRLPISVYFITQDEEERLPTALQAVKDWADEIIVVDSGSKDNTIKIAESYGAKVIHNEWKGFAMQKAFAAKQCKNDWVLDLDADEEVSQELQKKLQKLFAGSKQPEQGGFLMTWKVIYPGQDTSARFAHIDHIIRLYNRKKAAIKELEWSNNDRPQVHIGEIGRISEPVYHRTILSFSHLEKKISQLTLEQARTNVNKGKQIGAIKFYLDFPLKFLKYYFLRRMFVHGWYGFTLSIMSAYRNFMRLAKTRELQSIEKQKNKN